MHSWASEMSSGDGSHSGQGRLHSLFDGQMSGTHRPRIAEDLRSFSSGSGNSVTGNTLTPPTIGDEKPVASGNGLAVSIALTEPVLFLQGFDRQDISVRNTTMLRGSLHLRVSKSAKIKAITLKFRGRAVTEWPEGRRLGIDWIT